MKKILFLLLLFRISCYSQESGFLDFWKSEKVKITNERLLELLKNGNPKEYNQETKQNNEIQTSDNVIVSNDPLPESELHAAINPTNDQNIVVSPIRSGNGSLNDPLTCPVYFTKDGGITWKKSTFKNTPINSNESVVGGGDPVLAFDADGKLYFTWINLAFQVKGSNPDSSLIAIYWAWSSDGGETWKRELNHTFGKDIQKYSSGNNYGLKKFYDKQWMACDLSNSQYRNNLYVSHVLFDLQSNTSNIFVKTKKQNENEFKSQGVQITKKTYDLAQFGSLDVDNKGVIHVSFYGKTKVNGITSSGIYYTYSIDGGATFANEVKVSNIFFSAGSNFGSSTTDLIPGISSNRAYPYPQIVADKSSNANTNSNLYITFTGTGITNNLLGRNNVFIIKSTNSGQTWLPAKPILPVSQDDYQRFYSSTCVNPEGVLISSFYHMLNSNATTEYLSCFSFDGGTSFVSSVASTELTNFKTVGSKNNSFGIGEYNQTVSNKNYAFPVWTDGRNGDGNLDLYIGRIQLSEINKSKIENAVLINPQIIINSISPNPITQNAEINFTLDNISEVSFSLVDMIGKEIELFSKNTYKEGVNLEKFDISMFANGSYYIKLSSRGKSQSFRISIEK